MTQLCKLCQNETKLIKKSHIISEFLHDDLFDEHHKLIKFDLTKLNKKDERISKPSSGVYEGGILCLKCEKRIGVFETYLGDILKNNLKTNQKITLSRKFENDAKLFEIKNLNYQKTKLFLLSLLWRASISSFPEFKDVSLGMYEEKLRKQILDGNPSSDLEIQITIFRFEKNSNYSSFIGQFRRKKSENTVTYSIIIKGFLVIYYLKENSHSRLTQSKRLKEDGTLEIIEIPKDAVKKFMLGYLGYT